MLDAIELYGKLQIKRLAPVLGGTATRTLIGALVTRAIFHQAALATQTLLATTPADAATCDQVLAQARRLDPPALFADSFAAVRSFGWHRFRTGSLFGGLLGTHGSASLRETEQCSVILPRGSMIWLGWLQFGSYPA